jgi:putative ABC transport system substrate-binding protein
MPKARTLAVIYADMPQSHSYNRWLEGLVKNDPEFKDIKLVFRQVPLYQGEAGENRMAALVKRHVQELDGKVDAYLTPCDQLGARKPFASAVSATSRRPLIGLVRDDVMERWGAMASIYPSHASIANQSASMVVKLFAGKKIAEIPAEWPQKFGIAVDLRKAKRFGIEVPVELLQMAGENIVR